MMSRKTKSASYQVGYGKPPMRTRFRKGQSGNPGGRPCRTAIERAKALALQEAYRTITVKEGGRALALPAIQAVLRSQIALAAKGNVQAQRAVLAAIHTIEDENAVDAALLAAIQTTEQEATALAAQNTNTNTYKNMSYTEAARRIKSLLGLDEKEEGEEQKFSGEQDKRGVSAMPSGTTDASPTQKGATSTQVRSR